MGGRGWGAGLAVYSKTPDCGSVGLSRIGSRDGACGSVCRDQGPARLLGSGKDAQMLGYIQVVLCVRKGMPGHFKVF